MATGIYSWSQTAATNSTADSTINWAEGQAPSTVNDSARAVMAILARWRDDISGVQPSNVVQTSGGTANAQTLTTNGSIAALTNGWTVAFKAGASNTGACTLAVDGLTAKNIQRVSGTNLIGGEIISGCVYTVTYHQPADTWVLHHAVRPAGVELITSGTVSSAATLSIASPSFQSFRVVKFILTGFQPATDNVDLWMRTSTDGGSNYDAGASDYAWEWASPDSSDTVDTNKDTADAQLVLMTGIGNDTVESSNIEVTLCNPVSAAFYTQAFWSGTRLSPSSGVDFFSGGGARLTGANVDAVRFLFSSGNIDEGAYAVYGYA